MMKSKYYNNYTLAILLAFFVGLGILIPLLIAHCLALGDVPGWLIKFIYLLFGISVIGQFVSGNGYLQQLTDVITSEETLDNGLAHLCQQGPLASIHQLKKLLITLPKRMNLKFVGLSIGIIFSIIITIIELVQHVPLPFVADIGKCIAGALFLFSQVSTFAGLGNRLGASIDCVRKSTNMHYASAILCGIGVGLTLSFLIVIATGTPFGLSAILLTLTTVSSVASAAGYGGRVADFIFTQKCNAENIGTTIGVMVGLTLSLILFFAGVSSLPFLGAGMPALFSGMLLMAFCISACGGLGNRLGAATEKIIKPTVKKEEKKEEPPKPNNKRPLPVLKHKNYLCCTFGLFATIKNRRPEKLIQKEIAHVTNTIIKKR